MISILTVEVIAGLTHFVLLDRGFSMGTCLLTFLTDTIGFSFIGLTTDFGLGPTGRSETLDDGFLFL